MHVTDTLRNKDTLEELVNSVLVYADACAPIIHVRTSEMQRALLAIRKAVLTHSHVLREWNIIEGFYEPSLENLNELPEKSDGAVNFLPAFRRPYDELKDKTKPIGASYNEDAGDMVFTVYTDVSKLLDIPPVHYLFKLYRNELPTTGHRIIIITDDEPILDSLEPFVSTVRLDTPGIEELVNSAQGTVTATSEVNEELVVDLDEDDYERLSMMGSGMPRDQFTLAVSMSVLECIEKEETLDVDRVMKHIALGKTDVVNKNDLLELISTGAMGSVGGMNNLKEWVGKRKACYSQEALEFGVEPPKGIALVGPPGTGKSLVAKAIGGVLGVPVVRLDFGRVFNSFVGKSEERTRMALKMVEAMAPCVLFVDEIDKGLGGTGSGGDSGASSRVLGTFLTWLQDNDKPVFTMVTANNISNLPPELLRRGRFDDIFSTSLPNDEERVEILSIHLKLRGRSLDGYSEDDISRYLVASNRYVGAEIEAAVKDSLVNAFADSSEVDVDYIIDSLESMVPLSTSYKDVIDETIEWAKANATPVSKEESKTRSPSNKVTVRSRSKVTRTRGPKDTH
jgi:hypothetical protein